MSLWWQGPLFEVTFTVLLIYCGVVGLFPPAIFLPCAVFFPRTLTDPATAVQRYVPTAALLWAAAAWAVVQAVLILGCNAAFDSADSALTFYKDNRALFNTAGVWSWDVDGLRCALSLAPLMMFPLMALAAGRLFRYCEVAPAVHTPVPQGFLVLWAGLLAVSSVLIPTAVCAPLFVLYLVIIGACMIGRGAAGTMLLWCARISTLYATVLTMAFMLFQNASYEVSDREVGSVNWWHFTNENYYLQRNIAQLVCLFSTVYVSRLLHNGWRAPAGSQGGFAGTGDDFEEAKANEEGTTAALLDGTTAEEPSHANVDEMRYQKLDNAPSAEHRAFALTADGGVERPEPQSPSLFDRLTAKVSPVFNDALRTTVANRSAWLIFFFAAVCVFGPSLLSLVLLCAVIFVGCFTSLPFDTFALPLYVYCSIMSCAVYAVNILTGDISGAITIIVSNRERDGLVVPLIMQTLCTGVVALSWVLSASVQKKALTESTQSSKMRSVRRALRSDEEPVLQEVAALREGLCGAEGLTKLVVFPAVQRLLDNKLHGQEFEQVWAWSMALSRSAGAAVDALQEVSEYAHTLWEAEHAADAAGTAVHHADTDYRPFKDNAAPAVKHSHGNGNSNGDEQEMSSLNAPLVEGNGSSTVKRRRAQTTTAPPMSLNNDQGPSATASAPAVGGAFEQDQAAYMRRLDTEPVPREALSSDAFTLLMTTITVHNIQSRSYLFVPWNFIHHVTRHSTRHLALLFLFFAGTAATTLDVLHLVLLVAFVAFALSDTVARRLWLPCLLYLMAVTGALFALFAASGSDSFYKDTIDALPEALRDTVGLVAPPSRWAFVAYFAAIFAMATEYRSQEPLTLRRWFIARDWERMNAVPFVRKCRTYGAATTLLVIMMLRVILENNSFMMLGYVLVFLFACYAMALFTSRPKLIVSVWIFGTVYSVVCLTALLLFRFSEIRKVIDNHVDYKTCHPSCPADLGLVRDAPADLLALALIPDFASMLLIQLQIRLWVRFGPSLQLETTLREFDGVFPMLRAFLRQAYHLSLSVSALLETNIQVLVWGSFMLGAGLDATWLSAAYIVFFLLNLQGIVPLVYSSLHLVIVYVFRFPAVASDLGATAVSVLTTAGIVRSDAAALSRIIAGPTIVFVASLAYYNARGAAARADRGKREFQRIVAEERCQAADGTVTIVRSAVPPCAVEGVRFHILEGRPAVVDQPSTEYGVPPLVLAVWNVIAGVPSALAYECLLLLHLIGAAVGVQRAAGIVHIMIWTVLAQARRRRVANSLCLVNTFMTINSIISLVLYLMSVGIPSVWEEGTQPFVTKSDRNEWSIYAGYREHVNDAMTFFACAVMLAVMKDTMPRAAKAYAQFFEQTGHETLYDLIAANHEQLEECRNGRRENIDDVLPPPPVQSDPSNTSIVNGSLASAPPAPGQEATAVAMLTEDAGRAVESEVREVREKEAAVDRQVAEDTSMLQRLCVRIYCFVIPTAVLAFFEGAFRITVINIIIIISGLVMMTHQKRILWECTTLWPKWEKFVNAFPWLVVICNIPTLSDLILDANESFTHPFGIREGDAILGISPLRVVLLWTVFLQRRIFEEPYFNVILRELHHQQLKRIDLHNQLLEFLESREELARMRVQTVLMQRAKKLEDIREARAASVAGELAAPTLPPEHLDDADAVSCGSNASIHSAAAAERKKILTPVVDRDADVDSEAEAPRVTIKGEELEEPTESKEKSGKEDEWDAVSTQPSEDGDKKDGTADDEEGSEGSEAEDGETKWQKVERIVIIPATGWLHENSRCTQEELDEQPTIVRKFLVALASFLALHSGDVCFIVFSINFTISGTVFDAFLAISSLAYGFIVSPWPSQGYWTFCTAYSALGIIIKSALALIHYTSTFSRSTQDILAYSVMTFQDSRPESQQSTSTLFVQLLGDFMMFGFVIAHKQICARYGVYALVKSEGTSFLQNLVTTFGRGIDLYAVMLGVELLALAEFMFFYFKIAGKAQGSFVDSLQSNVLPGMLVVVMLASVVQMVTDRAMYLLAAPRARYAAHLVVVAAYHGAYIWWRRVPATSIPLGAAYFAMKQVAFMLTCIQLRTGYPVFRRHDPFTCGVELPRMIGYQVYRALPFIFELRCLLDWTCTSTTLSFPQWMKVEDALHESYARQLAAKAEMLAGVTIPKIKKALQGAMVFTVLLVVLFVPLLYYSTFNPILVDNSVQNIRVVSEFDHYTEWFEADTIDSLEKPHSFGTSIDRTRPELGSYAFDTSEDRLELLDLPHCSARVWAPSVSALEALDEKLAKTMRNETYTTIRTQIIITRKTATQGSERVITILQDYRLPYADASELHDFIKGHKDHVTMPLPSFYNPFVYNQPNKVTFFDQVPHNRMACQMNLTSAVDPVLRTPTRFSCIECTPLFGSGNDPTPTSPEYECTENDIACEKYNYEQHPTSLESSPLQNMYFVALSQPVPDSSSPLPNIGIIALYTTFILAIGQVLRSALGGTAYLAMLQDMADPKMLRQLVEYIQLTQTAVPTSPEVAHDNLLLEQLLYCELVDLLRSPETLLRVTGLRTVQQRVRVNRALREREQQKDKEV